MNQRQTTFRNAAIILALASSLAYPEGLANDAGARVTRTFQFDGPLRFSRTDSGTYQAALTSPIVDRSLAGKLLRLRMVSVSANVSADSNEPFPFDSEVLIFDGAAQSTLPGILGADHSDLDAARQYAASRRRAHVSMMSNSGGRAAGSLEPIRWQLNLGDMTKSSVMNVHEVIVDPFAAGDLGPTFQVLFWTLSGGSHEIELKDVALTTELSLSEPFDPDRRRIRLIIGYVFAVVIAATAILTVLSLVDIVRFRDERQQKRLFWVLIVELAVAGVAWFRDWL